MIAFHCALLPDSESVQVPAGIAALVHPFGSDLDTYPNEFDPASAILSQAFSRVFRLYLTASVSNRWSQNEWEQIITTIMKNDTTTTDDDVFGRVWGYFVREERDLNPSYAGVRFGADQDTFATIDLYLYDASDILCPCTLAYYGDACKGYSEYYGRNELLINANDSLCPSDTVCAKCGPITLDEMVNRGIAHELQHLCFRVNFAQAQSLVTSGRVSVGGRVVRDPDRWVDLRTDRLRLDGGVIRQKRHIYVAMHKPAGYVTTRRDERSLLTVYDLLGEVREWVFPVGRLDRETSGLLLFTNDTAFEPDETFTITLAGATGGATLGAPATATVTIVSEDPPRRGTLALASAAETVNEQDGSITLTVTRTGGTDGAVDVRYATTAGTAATADFTATDVEGALAELQSDNEAHVAAADPHTGYVLESAHTALAHDALALSHDSLANVSAVQGAREVPTGRALRADDQV